MPRKTIKAQEALANRSATQDTQEVVSRPTALDFKKTEKLKELIL
jgi:hypothetical protein